MICDWPDCNKSPPIHKLCSCTYCTWSNFLNGFCLSAYAPTFLFVCLDYGAAAGLAMPFCFWTSICCTCLHALAGKGSQCTVHVCEECFLALGPVCCCAPCLSAENTVNVSMCLYCYVWVIILWKANVHTYVYRDSEL